MAFRSSAKASSSSGGTITATPAGVAAHDYLGATYLVDALAPTLSVPAGWTNRANNAWGSGSPDGSTQFYADKDDASGTDAFGFSDSSSTSPSSLICAAWSGRDNAAPRSTAVVKTLNTSGNFSAVSATITGITASANDDIAVFLGTDQTSGASRWTFSTITGYTEQQDGVAIDWVSGIALDTKDNVSAGATGNFATTITDASSGSTGYGAIVVAIKVAAAGGTSVAPGAGTVTLTGFAPTVVQNTAVAPGAGTLTLSGFAPTVLQNTAVAPGAGALTITGFAPTVTQQINTPVAPGVGTLTITGFAPTVAQTANQAVAPDVGALTITGYAPTVVQTGIVLEQSSGGWPDHESLAELARRRKKREQGQALEQQDPAEVLVIEPVPRTARRTITRADLVGRASPPSTDASRDIAALAARRRRQRDEEELLFF